MFCSTCGQCLRNEDKFCSHCGKDASSSLSVTAAPSRVPCTSSNAGSKAIKSFAAYRKSKGHQWKQRVIKTAGKVKEEEVAVGIGLMEFNTKESRLRPVRRKRVMLRISNKAPYNDVCAQAAAKFRTYHINFYQEGEEYHLLYESGMEAQFLPGTTELRT
ncbi:hypothetical protein AWC38_SpisGene22542 [Stylophora pistillata]|uniref:Zinc-ribbon domain-containing protein n=1 Tax=Stylophora pistillata TaxID=50429 RepID=A0A2B4R992_STYPI|nr:hypothetical protein AWC38_SpisGene22542 [Stylophora pistillata]